MKFQNVIKIQTSVTEVFNFVANAENVPKWNYFVTEVRQVSNGPIGVGTTYHQTRKTDEQDYQVTHYEPDHRVAWKSLQKSGLQFERTMQLESDNDSTKLIDTLNLTLSNPLLNILASLFGFLTIRSTQAAVMENLGKLKELLETGTTQLQDGRVIKIQ